jgi:hypothetical protein
MVSIELIAVGVYSDPTLLNFPFVVYGVAGIILVSTIILFIIFREFSLKHAVGTVIITLLYKGSLALTYGLFFSNGSNLTTVIYGLFGIILFLAAFFFLKTYGKSPVDVKYTAADAIVLFIGTVPFIVDYVIGIFVLLLLWSLF